MRIDSRGIAYRTRTGRRAWLSRDEIASVALVDVEYTSTESTTVALYGLVIDHAGAVRVRIAAEGNRSRFGAAGKRKLRELLADSGLPLVYETSVLGMAKGYRRRWPEAFSFTHAHPVVTALIATVGWVLVVAPVLDRLLGT